MGRSAKGRRRWTSTLAEPIPEGPAGQPAHETGAEVAVIDLVEVPGVGKVSMTVPRPSSLLLGHAVEHLRKAKRLRNAVSRQIGRGRWVQPGFELHFTNEDLLFDFFEHAMAGVVLTHAALDNTLNELLPADFVFTAVDGTTWDRAEVESSFGLERRLTQVAAAATGRENIRHADPALFDLAMLLKSLRDDLAHAKRHRGYGGSSLNRTIFSDLFTADLDSLMGVPGAVAAHYGSG